jgi:hypothetical protein
MGKLRSAGKKKPISEGKVELRAGYEWIARVDAEAARLGIGRSAYIRMVVSEAMNRAEVTRNPTYSASTMASTPEGEQDGRGKS